MPIAGAAPGQGSRGFAPVAVVGIGEVTPQRRSGRSAGELVMEAIDAAIEDAGLRPTDIDAIVTEGGMMLHHIRPDDVADLLAVPDHSIITQLSIGGAGNVGAPALASALIEAGLASNVLTYFGGLYGSDEQAFMDYHAADPIKPHLEIPAGFVGQATYFAAWADRYIHDFGATAEDIGTFALATREWAVHHPQALRREPVDTNQYLESPLVADPLRVLDCCLLTDCAAAYIMTAAERAADHPRPPVLVSGCAIARGAPVSNHSFFSQHPDPYTMSTRLSGARALGTAGIALEDVDMVGVYDCFTITALLQLENLGFCGRGEGAAFVAEGHTGPGGALPTNTHGGLLSHSYAVGAGHMVEATRQLRKEALGASVEAEVALVAGYSAWDTAVSVLTS